MQKTAGDPRIAVFAPTALRQADLQALRAWHTARQRYFIYKACLDMALAVGLLVVCALPMLLIALMIRLDSPGPAIFAQKRVGARARWRDGRLVWETCHFTLYKFRTMCRDADCASHRAFIQALIQNDQDAMSACQGLDPRQLNTTQSSRYKMTHDPRITRIGRYLRKTSLDELPQLWNIVKGDMSLVGPRPPIPYEVEMYKPWHHRRLGAKPGLTGLWQVIARSSADFDEMVRLDIWYVQHQSLWLDFKIILATPLSVLRGKGAV